MRTEAIIYKNSEKNVILVAPPNPYIDTQGIKTATVIYNDPRKINEIQRRKIWAILGDISLWNGDETEILNLIFKNDFCNRNNVDFFSTSSESEYAASVTTAREYINYLIDFCLMNDIACYDSLLNRTDDISKYLYLCLYHKKCCLCGKKADYHHATGSRVGLGRNRKEIPILDTYGFALCRVHHNEAHYGENKMCDKYHIYSTKIDKVILKKWEEKQKKKG